MLFVDAQKTLARELDKFTSSGIDSTILDQIKSVLNFAKVEIGKSYLWRELKTESEIVILPNYTAGTVSFTTNTRTVQGSGTVWTSNMVGRYWQPSTSGYWYRISAVDTVNQILTLTSLIIEDTANGLAYKIWKRYYRVNSDIRLILPDYTDSSMPLPFTVEGYDYGSTDYTTGTISVNQNSNILTGVGTAFMGNVWPGDIILIQSDTYRIKTVDSDTQITMVNKANSTVPSSSYTITADTPYQADLSMSPGTYRVNLGNPYQVDISVAPTNNVLARYYYIRLLYNMVNDNDTTELPNKFDRCIIDFAKAEFRRATNTPNWEKEYMIAQARLEKLKLDKDLILFPYRLFHPHVITGAGRGRSQTILNM